MTDTQATQGHIPDGPQPQHTLIEGPNEPQGYGPVPPPLSNREWLCDDDHEYSLRREPSKDSMFLCNENLVMHDEKVCRRLTDEINFLMVVAGLFLAIVAAFTIESYKFLQEDKQDTMSDLLIEVVRLLNDTSAQGYAKLPKPFTPNHHAIVVNQLWFLSLILSLIAVGLGTFCLQWISAFLRDSALIQKTTPAELLAIRQLRYEGMVGWGVHHAPEALLVIVQLSIGLFGCGLIYFLWNIDKETATPALIAASLAGVTLLAMNLLPFLQSLLGAFIPVALTVPHCPHKSPISWLVLHTGVLLLHLLKLFLNLFPSLKEVGINVRLGKWLGKQARPFAVFRWREHDLASFTFREVWTDSGTLTGSQLHYLGLGVSAALDHLIYNHDGGEIVFSCLQDLQPMIATARDCKMILQLDVSGIEKDLLETTKFQLDRPPPHLTNIQLLLQYIQKLKVDFINALILQHLIQHIKKLDRISFHHRVELYIRVKNSAQILQPLESDSTRIGKSLHCPLKNHRDIGELNLELKFQFLSCVNRLIDTRQFTGLDILGAAAIVLIESSTASMNPPEIQDTDRFPQIESPVEEVHAAVHPVQGSAAENIPIRSPEGEPRMASSGPSGPRRERSDESQTEDPQLRASLTRLCPQIKVRLLELRSKDFQNKEHYEELQKLFGLPVNSDNTLPHETRDPHSMV